MTPAQNERNGALYAAARSGETGSLTVDRVSNESLHADAGWRNHDWREDGEERRALRYRALKEPWPRVGPRLRSAPPG